MDSARRRAFGHTIYWPASRRYKVESINAWASVRAAGGDFHTVPEFDHIVHELSAGCVCGPTVEPVERDDGSLAWTFTHHSLDGRELRE